MTDVRWQTLKNEHNFKSESSYGKTSVQTQENVDFQDGLPLFLFPDQAWALYGTVRKLV